MSEPITREQAVEVLKAVFDPEIPVNVWDLGLIYDLQVGDGNVAVKMTLTAPGCPIGPQIAAEIEERMLAAGAESTSVAFVWSPPWTTKMVTPDGRLQLQILDIPV